jgi:serine/threonine protein kinase
LDQTKTGSRLSWWPSPQDYNEAIQDLNANTLDLQLQNGEVEVTALGLPRPLCGSFASVYRVRSGNVDYAVRCFLRDTSDNEERYRHISDFVQTDDLPYTVTFDFLKKGILVNGHWYPTLKMEWVNGLTLDLFVEHHLGKPELGRLAESFKQMCADLHKAGIAHGDLQHGNILIHKEEIRLVDYDGMYVPAMKSMTANEIGHRNYQHPKRSGQHFGAYLDHFSAWVIYASLRALRLDPKLYHVLGAGDDCLLFRRDDFSEPEYSYAFSVLENHGNEEIRKLAKAVRLFTKMPVEKIPPLSDYLPDVSDLPALSARPTAPPRPAPVPPPRNSVQSLLPEWMKSGTTVATTRNTVKNLPANVEPELAQETPRIVFFQNSLGISPQIAQWLMLMNPLVWCMFLPLFVPNTWQGALWCFLFNIFIEWVIWFRPLKDGYLARNGVPARTTRIEVIQKTDAEGVDFYMLEYDFVTNSGKKVTTRKHIHASEALKYRAVQEATVLYDILEPSNNEWYSRLMYRAYPIITVPFGIEPELQGQIPRAVQMRPGTLIHPVYVNIAMLVIAMIFAFLVPGPAKGFGIGIAACAMLVIFLTSRSETQLVKNGLPAVGRALSRKPNDVNGSELVEIEFDSYRGRIRQTKELSKSDAESIGQSAFTVLYDAGDPTHSVIYPICLWRAK